MEQTQITWYPLRLTISTRHYAFGGTRIRELIGKAGLEHHKVLAETWEVSDVEGSIATVTNGSLAGQRLRDVTLKYPEELVGRGWSGPHFPLLAKFLDGTGMLPVHLHGDDKVGQEKFKEPNGKTEAWHILWTAPNSTILAGVKEGVTKEELREAFFQQDYDRVLNRMPIEAGHTVYVPAGVLHSFGPNTLVYEIQQTSDIGQTAMPYKTLDGSPYTKEEWAKNIENVLDEVHMKYQPNPHKGLTITASESQRTFLTAGPYFVMERILVKGSLHYPFETALIVTNIGEDTSFRYEGGEELLKKGESVLLPAALQKVEFLKGEIIVCYLPDLERDVIKPLKDAGIDQAAIDGFVHDKKFYD